MKHILKYSFYEMVRSRWIFIYTGFYFVVTLSLFLLSSDTAKVLVSMMNITLALSPLIGILFGTTYYHSSKDFIHMLMCQPISRWNIFLAIYGGLAAALIISILIGIGIPMLFFGILTSTYLVLFSLLLLMACVLSVIFSLIAFTIAIKFESKVKGFSIAILVWLFFAVVYDGLVLLIMLMFKDYPLDKFTIGVVVMNPIDLARILMIMKLDASAMMGYTGAVLTKFLGKGWGSVLITLSLLTWIIVPLFYLRRLENRKDF